MRVTTSLQNLLNARAMRLPTQPQEYAKAVSLMRVVLEGRIVPGANHASCRSQNPGCCTCAPQWRYRWAGACGPILSWGHLSSGHVQVAKKLTRMGIGGASDEGRLTRGVGWAAQGAAQGLAQVRLRRWHQSPGACGCTRCSSTSGPPWRWMWVFA